jgi:uncharacterized protein (TIGR03435 family)
MIAGAVTGWSQSRGSGTSALPSFEVASIKPNPLIKERGSKVINPGGLIYTLVSLSDCIEAAYGVKSHQISGPEWIRSERYDINARAETTSNSEQLMLMLQSLLSDRFKLKLHNERKELPVYVLTLGKGGHRLRPSEGSEAMKIQFAGAGMAFQNASMTDLVQFMSAFRLDRPIVENTGLAGTYNFTLTIASPGGDPSQAAGDIKRSMAQGGSAIFMDAVAPLGLKLDPQKALTDVLVVDHAERPSNQ